jgi:hypothetical protein
MHRHRARRFTSAFNALCQVCLQCLSPAKLA